MAFKLKPSCNEKLQFPDMTNMQILALAIEAAQQLQWKVEEISPDSILMNVPMDMWHNGEKVTFTIEDGSGKFVSVQSQCITMQFVDYGRNRKNILQLKDTINTIKAFITSEELNKKADKVEYEFNRQLTTEEKIQLEEIRKRKSFSSFFLPYKRHIATPILFYINILVFLFMGLSGTDLLKPNNISLLRWGADYAPLTLTGDWWRTLTSSFVHIGFFHLTMNIFVFAFIGSVVENIINTRRLFISYLLTGLCSSVLSLYMYPDMLSAGASGAIFGLFGILLAFVIFHPMDRSFQKGILLRTVLSFIGYNLLLGVANQEIDIVAHIGGLLSGFLLGIIYVVGARFKKKDAKNVVSILGELSIFSIFLFCFLGLCRNVPSNYEDIRFVWYNPPEKIFGNQPEKDATISGNETGIESSLSVESDSYTPLSDYDICRSYYDSATGFEIRYPSNWKKILKPEGLYAESEFPLIRLINGDNRLTVTITDCDTKKEFNETKTSRLFTSVNAKEDSSEEAEVSDISINYLPMSKITNVLHTKDESGMVKDGQKTILYHFQADKKRIFTITMIAYDLGAGDELQRILATVSITE